MRKIPFCLPDVGTEEINEIAEVIKSGWITTGAKTKELEKKVAGYCNTNRAVCLNSATACLEVILRILGIGPGDEVITCAYTYTASASPVCHVGAKLVLIDVAKDSYEMDYEQLEGAITERTKAIIPIDLAGIMCDYTKIYEIVERNKHMFRPSGEIQKAIGRVAVVADAAHAIGARMLIDGRWQMCGEVADFTSFSFHAVKNFTTAEGGALTWKQHEGIDDEWIYNQCMLLSLHGQSKDAFSKSQLGMWEYDIVSPAYKCNMTDIIAAMGVAQFDKYPDMLLKRRKMIEKYDTAFKRLGIMSMLHYSDTQVSSGHLYCVRIPGIEEQKRNELIIKLAECGVTTNVHYKPLPMMTGYMQLGFDIKNYPNAYNQYKNEITLPLYTRLSDEDMDYIIEKFVSVVSEVGR